MRHTRPASLAPNNWTACSFSTLDQHMNWTGFGLQRHQLKFWIPASLQPPGLSGWRVRWLVVGGWRSAVVLLQLKWVLLECVLSSVASYPWAIKIRRVEQLQQQQQQQQITPVELSVAVAVAVACIKNSGGIVKQ